MMKNYFLTIQELISRPRNVIDSFLHSGTSGFTHPFLTLVISAVATSAVLTAGYILANFPASNVPEIPAEDIQQVINAWISITDFRAFTQFMPLLMGVLLIPALSIAGAFFYREQLAGFYQNIVLNSYLLSLVAIAQIIFIPVWIFAGEEYTEPGLYRYAPAAVAGIILMRSYWQYFRPDTPLMWVRMVSVIASGYVFFVFTSVFVTSVIGYMIFAVNRILELALQA